MSYILDALRKAETERRGVSLVDHVAPQSRVPYKTLVGTLFLLNAVLFAWLLLDPTNVPESTSASAQKRTDQNRFIEEDLRSKSGEPVPSSISKSQLTPPTVSGVQEVDPPPNGPELIAAATVGIPIIGEIDYASSQCPSDLIFVGNTGTNGKSIYYISVGSLLPPPARLAPRADG